MTERNVTIYNESCHISLIVYKKLSKIVVLENKELLLLKYSSSSTFYSLYGPLLDMGQHMEHFILKYLFQPIAVHST